MKVSKEKAAEHRVAMVRAASRLFRRRGVSHVGVAEVTSAAGLTHGGFYGHFSSKDALAAETCGHDFEVSLARLAGLEGRDGFLTWLDVYVSERHRDHLDGGCPMPAYVADVSRQNRAFQKRFAAGVTRFIDAIAERLSPVRGKRAQAARRERAILVLSAMIGSQALARATARVNPQQSAEIMSAVRKELHALV
jgi:TetR/AcrR family transcriptional repressor of nem operon